MGSSNVFCRQYWAIYEITRLRCNVEVQKHVFQILIGKCRGAGARSIVRERYDHEPGRTAIFAGEGHCFDCLTPSSSILREGEAAMLQYLCHAFSYNAQGQQATHTMRHRTGHGGWHIVTLIWG